MIEIKVEPWAVTGTSIKEDARRLKEPLLSGLVFGLYNLPLSFGWSKVFGDDRHSNGIFYDELPATEVEKRRVRWGND